MDTEETLNNPLILTILLWIARNAQPPFARGLLRLALTLRGSLISLDRNQRALLKNLEVIFGGQYDLKQLTEITLRCFSLRSMAVYDYYHYVKRKDELRRKIRLSDNAQAFIDYFRQNRQGAVAVSPHTIAADIVGMELAQHIQPVQVISIANPTRSYKQDNQVREAYGIRVTPASLTALHIAADTIKRGGLVATGTDRANPSEQYMVSFFGKKTRLPTLYTRMALRFQVPIFHFVGSVTPDGTYYLDASGPIYPQANPDHEQEIVRNTETILKLTEKAILENPDQWGMFHPVWDDQLFVTKESNNEQKKQIRQESQS